MRRLRLRRVGELGAYRLRAAARTGRDGCCSSVVRTSRSAAAGTLPGGFLGEAEHPLDALRRELLEETGLEIHPGEFVGAWIDRYGDAPGAHFTLNLYWRAGVVGGEERPADDVSELRWFARRSCRRRNELAFTNVPLVLDAWLALDAGCNVRPEPPSSAQ